MHVLGKPVERHFAPEPLFLGGFEHLGPDGGKLHPKADVVDESGNLLCILAPFDPAGDQIGQGRQSFPIDASLQRMIAELKTRLRYLAQLRRCAAVFRQVGMHHQRPAAGQRLIVLHRVACN